MPLFFWVEGGKEAVYRPQPSVRASTYYVLHTACSPCYRSSPGGSPKKKKISKAETKNMGITIPSICGVFGVKYVAVEAIRVLTIVKNAQVEEPPLAGSNPLKAPDKPSGGSLWGR